MEAVPRMKKICKVCKKCKEEKERRNAELSTNAKTENKTKYAKSGKIA